MWVVKLGYACKLQKQNGENCQLVPGIVEFFCFYKKNSLSVFMSSLLLYVQINCR